MSSSVREGTNVARLELETVLPAWCALKWYHPVWCGLFAASFLYFNYLPVSSSATWHDVAAGRAHWNVALDYSQHLLPLSEGMRNAAIGNAGIGTIFTVYHWGGAELLSLWFAILQTTALIVWSVVLYRLTQRWWAVFGALFIVLASFFEVTGLQSQSFGQLAFAILLLLLTQKTNGRWTISMWSTAGHWSWIFCAVLFGVWVNFHASVIIGIVFLLCYALARAVECGRSLLRDDEFRARMWLFELALLVTLLNPIGLGLWKAALWWPDNPFFNALGGWSPIVLAGWNGAAITVAWFLWFVASRRSPNIPVFLTLAALVATVAAACCQSCIIWFAPVMMVAIAELIGRSRAYGPENANESQYRRRPFQFAYTMVSILVLWIGFCFSPSGTVLLGGQARSELQVLGESTPVSAREFIRSHNPEGMIWCPSYWSGWIQSGANIPVYANDHSYRLPSKAILDYETIYEGRGNWQQLTEQYAVSNLVIDKQRQTQMVRQLKINGDKWEIAYEDKIALVAWRKTKT